jgi:DNA topoisomerase IA
MAPTPPPRSSRYHAIWEFPYNINGQPVDMVFTSVSGHLMEMDFPESYKRWSACSPLELYSAPINKTVGKVGIGSSRAGLLDAHQAELRARTTGTDRRRR